MDRVIRQPMPEVRHLRALLLGLAVAFLLGLRFVVFADEATSCPDYERALDTVLIAAETLSEISGLVASRSQPGILWVHNDSGDGAVVYAIDLQGQLLAEVELVDADGNSVDAVDCEDIALGPGPNGGQSLYLADIGDNAAARESVRIYHFTEPQIEILEHEQIAKMKAECDVIEAVYPDGPRDAETLLVDPITGDIVIVSKDFIHARSYRVPVAVGGVATMGFLVELSWGFMTGGDISADGSSILLRGYWNAQMWQRGVGDGWWMSLATAGCPVALAMEPQGEAIGFDADQDGYFTISEGLHPSLHSYRVLLVDAVD